MHRAAVFAAAFVHAAATAQAPAAEPDPLVAQATANLATIGYTVPPAVTTVDRTSREVIADLDAQQDVLFPRDAFTVQHALFTALGVRTGKDGAALRRQAVAGMARGLAAYYDPIGKCFVLLASNSRSVSEALAGSALPLVTHELVHACQDAREGGLAGRFAPATSTLDQAMVWRMVLEGEAEVAATAAMRGADAVAKLAAASGGSIDRLLAGELTGLLYANGRRLTATRFLAKGWPGVQDLWAQPPTSSEQVLHPTKLGTDQPCPVTLPEFADDELVAATTIGELMTYHLLRTQGDDVETASLAAAGWDGDRVAVLRAKAGRPTAVVWRSVWDRAEDAEQFAATQAANERAVVRVTGRGVDFVASTDRDWRERLATACAKAPGEWPETASDAASTEAIETALRAAGAANEVRENRWELRDHGLSIPVPKGFELREVNGVKMLMHAESAKQGFAVNVNVQVTPCGTLADAAAVLAANKQELERLRTLTIDRMEIGAIGEHEVVRGEFHGRIGTMAPIHCLQLYCLRGEHQITVTASAALGRWAEYEAMLRELMAGVRLSVK